jgi:hypothetical protein
MSNQSLWDSLSSVLDTAMGVKRPEDLQRYVNYLIISLLALTAWLMYTVPEQRTLLGGFLILLIGLMASIAWVLSEVRALKRSH